MEIRILRSADAPDVDALICARDYFSSIRNESELQVARLHQRQHSRNLLDAFVQQKGIGRIFGAYEEGCLTGMLVALTSDCQVNYFINRAYTLPGVSNGPEILSALMKTCIATFEQEGYYRFYTVYTESKIKAYQRLWRTSESLKGYISYTELRVPPHERVAQSELWEKLYGRLTLPEWSAVRAFVKPHGDVIDRMYHG